MESIKEVNVFSLSNLTDPSIVCEIPKKHFKISGMISFSLIEYNFFFQIIERDTIKNKRNK